ncbi:MAG: hypothetical protein JSV05_07710 [Candidatus Bathyarchaeota archaeon]|nr:MAG: hypothetical protein JSV05_07710 [Candidatus Bathyarchaeota archaeon]
MQEELTSIKIKKETRDVLKSVGKKGETYDDIINRLLDRVLRRKKGKPDASE